MATERRKIRKGGMWGCGGEMDVEEKCRRAGRIYAAGEMQT
jgi:hypothetical protein